MAHSFFQTVANAIAGNFGLVMMAVLVAGAVIAAFVSRSQTSVSPTKDWRARPRLPDASPPAEPSWPAQPLDPSRAAPIEPVSPAAPDEPAPSLPPLTLPKPAPAAASSRERGLIALVGAFIVILGAMIPSSPWVANGVLPMVGKRAYGVLAFFACLQAWRGSFRSMAASGGIAVGLFGVSALVGLVVSLAHPKGSVQLDPQFFAIGWSWLFMFVGSIFILVAAWFDMGASQDET